MDFPRRIIETKSYIPLIDKVYLGMIYLSLATLLIVYWIPHISTILNVAVMMIMPITLIAAILAHLRGKRFAYSVFLVVPIYLVTVSPFILASTGAIEAHIYYLEITHIGLLLAVLLHSLTLAEKTQELNESKKLAQTASEAKSQFLANMSHELRTPMNAVIGLGQLLLRTPLNNEQHEYVGKSLRSADHMMELINKCLPFPELMPTNWSLQ